MLAKVPARKIRPWLGLTALFILLLAACTPKTELGPEEFDVVLTLYNEDFDFGAIRSYAMPDSIVHVEDSQNNDPPLRDFDSLILEEIAAHMEARGYVREFEPETVRPDVLLLVSAAANQRYFAFNTYGWWSSWNWYPGTSYWGSTWGYNYPWVNTNVIPYTSGTLLMEMVDVSNPDEDDELIPVVWLGAINGILDDTSEGLRTRITTNIDRVFEQSPYLVSRSDGGP